MKDVIDPCKVKVVGPGLGTGVRAKTPQSFTVDASKAGIAPLEVVVAGLRGKDLPILKYSNNLTILKVTIPFFISGGYL